MSRPQILGCMLRSKIQLMTIVIINNETHSPFAHYSILSHTMHRGMVVHGNCTECENCGKSDKRMLEHEYICMNCGVIDGSIMIVDEMSEQRRQWDTDDQHKPKTSSSLLPRLHSKHGDTTDRVSKRAFPIAKRAAQLFSIETDQVPQEAACLYVATQKQSSGHVSKVDVVACTMIAAHRRTAQDLQDASLVFTLKTKHLMTAIERVQECVLMGDKSLASAYGYLFNMVGERRSVHLVKEALEHLLEVTQDDVVRGRISESSWGIQSLADDMMKHVQECRLIGGISLEIFARALIIVSSELHVGQRNVPAPPKVFISACMLHLHRDTWDQAQARWPGGGKLSFDKHVVEKQRLREYGSIKPRAVPGPCSGVQVHPTIQAKRDTRARVACQFATEPRFHALAGTSIDAGVTHVCVVMVSNNAQLQHFVNQHLDGVGTLMDVCLAAIQPLTQISVFVDPIIVSMVTNTPGFAHAISLARKFKAPISNLDPSFMPRELTRWGM